MGGAELMCKFAAELSHGVGGTYFDNGANMPAIIPIRSAVFLLGSRGAGNQASIR